MGRKRKSSRKNQLVQSRKGVQYLRTTTRPMRTYERPFYRIPIGLPERYVCRLRYCEEVSLNCATGSVLVAEYRANSIYDPRVAVGGHQPLYFDQLCLFYNKFRVTSSRIRVTHTPINNAALAAPAWGIRLTDVSGETAGLTLEGILENEHGTRKRVFAIGENSAITKGKTSGNNLKLNFDMKKFFNLETADDASFVCTAAADCTEQAYYALWTASVGANEPELANFIVEIDYTVVCEGSQAMASS